MNSKISEKDKKTWDEFLSKNQKLPNKDNEQAKTQVKAHSQAKVKTIAQAKANTKA